MTAGERLIARLPRVKGPYTANAAIKDLTWFRAGGPADVLYIPSDADDLAAFLAGCPGDVPVMVMGVGSNLLVRDSGIEGEIGKVLAGGDAPTLFVLNRKRDPQVRRHPVQVE